MVPAEEPSTKFSVEAWLAKFKAGGYQSGGGARKAAARAGWPQHDKARAAQIVDEFERDPDTLASAVFYQLPRADVPEPEKKQDRWAFLNRGETLSTLEATLALAERVSKHHASTSETLVRYRALEPSLTTSALQEDIEALRTVTSLLNRAVKEVLGETVQAELAEPFKKPPVSEPVPPVRAPSTSTSSLLDREPTDEEKREIAMLRRTDPKFLHVPSAQAGKVFTG